MLLVEVSQKNEAGQIVGVGTIAFEGLQIPKESGGVRMHGGKFVPYRAVLSPKDFVSKEIVEQIRSRLESGEVMGKSVEYVWRA